MFHSIVFTDIGGFFLHCDIKYFACDVYSFQLCTSVFSRHTGEPLTNYIPVLDTYIGNTQREAPSGVQRFLFTPGLHSEQVDFPVVTPRGQDSGIWREAQSPGINWNKSERINLNNCYTGIRKLPCGSHKVIEMCSYIYIFNNLNMLIFKRD